MLHLCPSTTQPFLLAQGNTIGTTQTQSEPGYGLATVIFYEDLTICISPLPNFVLCALCFLLCDTQWHSQVIDNARAQHGHTMLLRTAVQSTEATSGVGGACPSVPYLDHAIGDMPCILMLCICSPQHQSLKKPSVPRPLEQLPQLQLSRSAATHNPP